MTATVIRLPVLDRPPRNPVLRTEPLSVSRLRKYAECPDAFYQHYIRRKTRRCGAVYREAIPGWWWDGGSEGEVCERPVLARPPHGTTCERGHLGAPILLPETTADVRTAWQEAAAEPATIGKVVHRVLDDLYTRAALYGDPRFDRIWATTRYEALYTAAGLRGAATYRDGLMMLRTYIDRHPDAEIDTLVATELEFRIAYAGYTFYGLIDLVRRQDGRYRVVDYKSNRRLYPDEEVRTDVQLGCYAYVMHVLFGVEEVDVAFEMLRHETTQEGTRTLVEMRQAMDYLVAIARQAEYTEAFPAVVHANCPWCDYRTRCASYRLAVSSPDDLVGALATEDWDALAEQRRALEGAKKIAEKRLETIDEIFAARIEREGEFTAAGLVHEFSVWPKKDYDVREVDALLARHGIAPDPTKYAFVYKSKLEAYIDDHGRSLTPKRINMLKVQLEGISTPTTKRPRIDSRKARK